MPGLLFSADLATASRVQAAAARTGRTMIVAMNEARLQQMAAASAPVLVLLDLTAPFQPAELVPILRSQGATTIVAFGPHVHKPRLEAATGAGCDLVLSRGELHAQIDALLEKYLPSTSG